jgi:DNA-binding XRE family transcriptional regulator
MSTYRRWSKMRADLVEQGLLDEERVAEIGKQLRAEVRAHRLAEVRERYDVSQTTLAERIGVTQSRVSRIERGDVEHAELATIRDYIEALGGEMEVLAKFGDERIVIA